MTTADVEHFIGGFRNFQGQPACLRNVAHVNEIAPLFAVFVHEWRIVVEETRSKNRQHTGVRIRERLTRTENIKEAQRNGGDSVRASNGHAQALLMELANGIDGRQRGTL